MALRETTKEYRKIAKVTSDFTIADILDDARALIERGWCQTRYGENAFGERVSSESPDAVRWCATGAIERVCIFRARETGGYFQLWSDVTNALDKSIGEFRTCWNDHPDRTQQEVVEAFCRCSAELRRIGPSDTWTKADAYLTDIERALCGVAEKSA
jgi:hypothetical protein